METAAPERRSMNLNILDDPFATDDEVDHALGIPTMADVLGRGTTDTTPDNFALPMSEPSGSVRNRGGTVSGSSSPETPDYHHENDIDTNYETGGTMPNDTTTEHPDN